MMNVQIDIINPAMLTGIIISIQGPLTLSFPVRASVVRMPTFPRGVIFSAPSIGRSPDRKTLTIAKIMIFYCTRLLFNISSASIAFYRYSFTSNTEPAYALMFPITSCATKAGLMFPVCFYLERVLADFTNNSFHIYIIPRMDN